MDVPERKSLPSLLVREPYLLKQVRRINAAFGEGSEDVDWETIYDALKKIIPHLRHTKFFSQEEKTEWWTLVNIWLLPTDYGRLEQAKRQLLHITGELFLVEGKAILALHRKTSWKTVWRQVEIVRRHLKRTNFVIPDLRVIGLRLLDEQVRELRVIQREHSKARAELSAGLTELLKIVGSSMLPNGSTGIFPEDPFDPLDEKHSLITLTEVMKARNERLRKQLEMQFQLLRELWHKFSVIKGELSSSDSQQIFDMLNEVQRGSSSLRESWVKSWQSFHETRLNVLRVLGCSGAERVEARVEDLMAQVGYCQFHVLELEGRFDWAEGSRSQGQITRLLNEKRAMLERLRSEISDAQRLLREESDQKS